MAGEVDYIATYTIERPDGPIVLPCQSMEGGHPEPEQGKSRNPVTGRTSARGGLRERSNVTVEVEIDALVWSQKRRINDSAGIDRFRAVKQHVDARRAPIGDPEVFTGVHGTPDWGSFDINGGDNTSLLEIESTVDDL